jgi:crotonobetainyl-CoA:carnitine CoA-transferase CaiB-like acyl-CoA transferase
VGISLCDIGAGITAYTGILEALIERANTGVARCIEVSLFDVAAEWMTVPYLHARYGSGAPKHTGLSHPSIAPYGAFATQDGLLTLISIQNENEWARLTTQVLSSTQLCSDSRFSSNDDRVANRAELESAMTTIIAKMSANQFRQALAAASLAYGAVNSVDELIKHAALRDRQLHNSVGDLITLPAHPVLLAESPSCNKPKVPKVGEHTEVIRQEFS